MTAEIWLRWAQMVDLALVFGAPFTAVLWGERRGGRLWRAFLGVGCLLGLAVSALFFLATLASMAGGAITDLDHGLMATMLTGSALGDSVIVRVAALSIVLALMGARRDAPLMPVASIAAVAVASLAWGGHAAASQGLAGALRLVVDCTHLWAGLTWLGALLLLTARLWRARAEDDAALAVLAHRLHAFALIGGGLVAVIVASGIGNLLFLAPPGRWVALAGQPYGCWMIAKLGMASLMLLLAAANRWRFVPAMARADEAGQQRTALAALRRSVTTEMILGLAVAGCVALAGTLDPGV
jgi:putative copper resistance protein D